MRKLFNSIVLFCVVMFSICGASLNFGESNVYHFKFTKTGDTELWFYDPSTNLKKTSFAFPSVSSSTAPSSVDVGVHYSVQAEGFQISVIFASEAYTGNNTGTGFMLARIKADGSSSTEDGLNYSVSLNNNKGISLTGNQWKIGMRMEDRTLVLADKKDVSLLSTTSDDVVMHLTIAPPKGESYTAGQYSGNIYLVLSTYS